MASTVLPCPPYANHAHLPATGQKVLDSVSRIPDEARSLSREVCLHSSSVWLTCDKVGSLRRGLRAHFPSGRPQGKTSRCISTPGICRVRDVVNPRNLKEVLGEPHRERPSGGWTLILIICRLSYIHTHGASSITP